MPRLQIEMLESRINPTGPVIVDPIGIPTTLMPKVTEAVAAAPADADAAAIQKIIQQTLASLGVIW